MKILLLLDQDNTKYSKSNVRSKDHSHKNANSAHHLRLGFQNYYKGDNDSTYSRYVCQHSDTFE